MLKRRLLTAFVGSVVFTLVACGGQSKRNPAGNGPGSGAGAHSQGADPGSGSDGGEGGAPESVTSNGGSSRGGATSVGGGNPTDGGMGGEADSAAGTSANAQGGVASTDQFCPLGSFDTDLTDDALTCQPWSICQPGTYEDGLPGYKHDQVCIECPEGTYNDRVRSVACNPWNECALGEQVDFPGSAAQDRTCKPADLFPGRGFTDHVAGRMEVTPQGVYLLGHNFSAPDPVVVRYSLTGDSVSEWPVLGASEDVTWLVDDLTHVADELFVTGYRNRRDTTEWIELQPGFLKKFSATGTLLWDKEFGKPELRVGPASLTSRDDKVYVVSMVGEMRCKLGETEWDVICDAPQNAESKLMLDVFDASDGRLTLEKALEEPSNVWSVIDLAVGPNGHLYVAVTRGSAEESFVLEFDAAGLPVAERAFGEKTKVTQLALDGGGNVYVLAAGSRDGWTSETTLYRLDTEAPLLKEGETELYEISVFTPTADGFLLAGSGEEGAPLLLRLDGSGKILSREVLEDIYPASFSGIEQGSDGTLYVGGTSRGMFVAPWPE